MQGDFQRAYEHVCNNAEKADGAYVSLYLQTSGYGGPEEGGWDWHDDNLVCYQRVTTKEQAESLRELINALAESRNEDARMAYGDHCLRTCEWLDERGLDADFLPDPAPPDKYWVAVEDRPGACESRGCRHYE